MLDIKFLRSNPEIVKQNIKNNLCFTYISMERGPSKFILKALFFLIRGLTYLTFS